MKSGFFAEFTLNGGPQKQILRFAQDDREGLRMTANAETAVILRSVATKDLLDE